MSYIIEHPFLYIVLEHSLGPVYDLETKDLVRGGSDAVLHGIYTDRAMALGKAEKIFPTAIGYVSILKKPINGKIKKCPIGKSVLDLFGRGEE